MIVSSWIFRKDGRLCRIVASNFELSPFVFTPSRTLTIGLQSGKTATVAVVGTKGLTIIRSSTKPVWQVTAQFCSGLAVPTWAALKKTNLFQLEYFDI